MWDLEYIPSNNRDYAQGVKLIKKIELNIIKYPYQPLIDKKNIRNVEYNKKKHMIIQGSSTDDQRMEIKTGDNISV